MNEFRTIFVYCALLVIRTAMAALLCASSSLKAWELLANQETVAYSIFARYFVTLLITAEFALAMIIITGCYWQLIRYIAIFLFSMFGSYSLYLGIGGAVSCRCFGPMSVRPWWTFGLDLLIVSGLIAEWWWERMSILFNATDSTKPFSQQRHRVWFASIGGVSCLVFIALIWQTRPGRDFTNPLLHTVGKLTILEPENWTGQKFPLASMIDVDLTRGEWIVLLHRHDCSECQKALPLNEELAFTDSDIRIATIEIPPYSIDGGYGESHCIRARLSDKREWFVQTPIELQLVDGRVISASIDLPSVRDALPTSLSHRSAVTRWLVVANPHSLN